MEIGVHLRVRISEVDDTPWGELEVATECFCDQRSLICLIDSSVGADVAPKLLEYLANLTTAWGCRHHHLELDRLPISLNQLLRFLGIKRQGPWIAALHERAWPKRVLRRLPQTSPCCLGIGFEINRHAK